MQPLPEEQPSAPDDRGGSPRRDADPHQAEWERFESEWERFEAGWRQYEGREAALAAVRLGVIGLFVLGIVLGPMALHQVWRAETFGVRPVRGEILGWAATLLGLLHLAIVLLLLSPGLLGAPL